MPALTSRPLAVRPAKQAVAPASRHPSRSSTYRDPFLRGVRTSHPIAYPLRAPFHKRFSETATGTLLSVRSPSKTLPYWQEHVGKLTICRTPGIGSHWPSVTVSRDGDKWFRERSMLGWAAL